MHTEKSVKELDEQLNLSQQEILVALGKHLVYGAPVLTHQSSCQLVQKDYISAFNHKTHLATWVAYTLEGQVGHIQLNYFRFRLFSTFIDKKMIPAEYDKTSKYLLLAFNDNMTVYELKVLVCLILCNGTLLK